MNCHHVMEPFNIPEGTKIVLAGNPNVGKSVFSMPLPDYMWMFPISGHHGRYQYRKV